MRQLTIGFMALALASCLTANGEETRPLLVTIDDLPLTAAATLHPDPDERARVTEGLLAVLARHDVRAVGLVTWSNVVADADLKLLERWLDAGHELGNHSFHHLNFTRTASADYVGDVDAARHELAAFLAGHGRQPRFFRFPFLREGDTPAKLEAMRAFLAESGQRNLPVTLDNQDWSFARPWLEARRRGDAAEMARVAEAYHESLHLSIRHHENVGDQLFERPVPQILLLHAMELGVAEWDLLFQWLADRGYRFATADEVLADPAFAVPHAYVGPRGFGLWDRLLVERRRAEARREIEELVARQVAAWNRGDLEAFCAEYHDGAVFVSPSGLTRGRQAVLDRYRQRYPDRAAQGELEIEILELATIDGTEVSMLGDARPGRVHGATVVGRWTLRYGGDAERETATGSTLIVFQRDAVDGGWKIVRDASM